MDNLLKRAIELTLEQGFGSKSLLQRKLLISHSKVETLLSEMEKLSIVGSKVGAQPKKLIVKSYDTSDTNTNQSF